MLVLCWGHLLAYAMHTDAHARTEADRGALPRVGRRHSQVCRRPVVDTT